ncbi:MAG TPA: hypothetical protein VNM34_14850 [Verrucomicrobiae bacterium]|nr:hypothetical protein [Verrucomicrobiae bacterium]
MSGASRAVLVLLALCSAAAAQVVRACNYGTAAFGGWHRTTVDSLPPHLRGVTSDKSVEYAVGRPVGLMGYALDVRVKLGPGQSAKYDLGASSPVDGPQKVTPEEAGAPVVGGLKLPLLSAEVDGAGTAFHWRGRPWPSAPMFCADAWATAYPGQGWFPGELVVTASDPSVPDITAAVPASGLTFAWSTGIACVDGYQLAVPTVLVPGGDWFCDGQARAWRFVSGVGGTIDAAHSALGESAAAIAVCGIQRPGLLGAPGTAPAGFDPVAWGHERLPLARAALQGWEILRDSRGGSVGVPKRAGDTGDHEDWPGLNKGTEEYLSPATGPYLVRYYAALRQLSRPCHHLEKDGSPLRLALHPGCSLWVARPNFADGGVTDYLGKTRRPTLEEGHGWEGPDSEHWLIGTVAQAYQWTASPALGWEVEHEARLFMLTETVDPRFATTSLTDASRAWGFWMSVGAWCWQLCPDRELAEQVRRRIVDRVALLAPRWSWVPQPAAWFDVRPAGSIPGPIGGGFAQASMQYQQNMPGASWQVVGELLGADDGAQAVEIGRRMARACVDCGWSPSGSRLVLWDGVGFNPDGAPLRPDQFVEGQGAHRSGFFDGNWGLAGAWGVLRADPKNARALAIIAQARALPPTPNQPVPLNDWFLPLGTRR